MDKSYIRNLVEKLSDKLAKEIEKEKESSDSEHAKDDVIITSDTAYKLAHLIENTKTEEEAYLITDSILEATQSEPLESGHDVASQIWDYTVDWEKVRWKDSKSETKEIKPQTYTLISKETLENLLDSMHEGHSELKQAHQKLWAIERKEHGEPTLEGRTVLDLIASGMARFDLMIETIRLAAEKTKPLKEIIE